MQPLNPFLKAFFRSSIPSQCSPTSQYIILVPTAESLWSNRDSDSNHLLSELAASEEFLGSHVLRLSASAGSAGKEVGNIRENRSKAKQYNTINGKAVIIREAFVYSNKGFKNLNQAQLLGDLLYYQDIVDSQQWLIYYISRPLVGSIEPVKLTIARLPESQEQHRDQNAAGPSSYDELASPQGPNKKEVRSFHELLSSFPMIARQMQAGLERIFKDLHQEMERPPPPPSKAPVVRHGRSASTSSTSTANGSVLGGPSYNQSRRTSFTSYSTNVDEDENLMRRAVENSVTEVIDLFQLVDKQQLSLLGATTELTGPVVERYIERYVAEQVHESAVFPKICSLHRRDDLELERRIRQMKFIDIAQVGIDIDGGREGKQKLLSRISQGIKSFKELKSANSPQQMLDIIVATEKAVASSGTPDANGVPSKEKLVSAALNADTLVSLLLLVVIRSGIKNLQAILAYIRGFIFIDDVDSGELGYALSTYEAVLSYLSTDAGGLRVASRRNKRLWDAIKSNNINEMEAILEPDSSSISYDFDSSISRDSAEGSLDGEHDGNHDAYGQDENALGSRHFDDFSRDSRENQHSDLSHVFPFQKRGESLPLAHRPKPKRVSIDIQSLSSDVSLQSRSSTLNSFASGIEGDTSIEKLCQTLDLSGNSLMMMAVEAGKPDALEYLFELEEYFPLPAILEDTNGDRTTLLSAAIQALDYPEKQRPTFAEPSRNGAAEGHNEAPRNHADASIAEYGHTDDASDPKRQVVDIILEKVSLASFPQIKAYLQRTGGAMDRTVAHYLFNAPQLIEIFNVLLPWRQKDKTGATPLMALFRCYDHPDYHSMIDRALEIATGEQGDGMPLHLDNHIDNKGNSLLHAVNDHTIALRILQHCDSDPNAVNHKKLTPLMNASRYGRFTTIQTMFQDNRIDIQAKDYRGMAAVELVKNDEMRNNFDNLVLIKQPPANDGRVTAIVRSFFVEDGTIRLIIKTATRSDDGMISVMTCRRSLSDFENLAKWLAIEHPASWLPSIFNFRSPFQIPSRPSRAVLHDIQMRLNKFLEIMLAHTTFAQHELLWEFILVPEIQPDMMAERSLLKSDIRQEKIKEEYEPLDNYRETETFVMHAQESIRGVNAATKALVHRVNQTINASSDMNVAFEMVNRHLTSLPFLPGAYISSLARYSAALSPGESDPYKAFHDDCLAVLSTMMAILSSLARPHAIISNIQGIEKAIEKQRSSMKRSDRWPLGLLEETRKQAQLDAQDRLDKTFEELRVVRCELRYTQQTVASELAGWQELHNKMIKRAIRGLARRTVVKEKDRLEAMKRALRGVQEAKAE